MEKRYIIYVLIIIICIIALCIGVYAQVFNENENDQLMINISKNDEAEKTAQIEENIKSDFNNIFEDKLIYVTTNISNNASRKELGKDLIYTANQVSKTEKGKYEMNINIPTINISGNIPSQINKQIEQILITKATTLLTTNVTKYTIYNIDYVGYVNSNILSLVIRATLKEGDEPQRAIFMTYNYNLDTGKLATLNELLELKNIKTQTLQNKINKEISDISRKTESLKEIGYTVYTRTPSDDMYKVENTTNFFLGAEGYLYILYPYGNNNNTSEVDVIII